MVKDNLLLEKQKSKINTLPSFFSSDDEELKYINNYFDDEKIETPKKEKSNKISGYKPITISKKERMVLIQSIRYNDNFVMPFVADEKTIKSLNEKGFITKNEEEKYFSVKKNVCLLFKIEGFTSFDEIVEE